MAVENVKLTEILVFKRLDLNMSPGINVIIGEKVQEKHIY